MSLNLQIPSIERYIVIPEQEGQGPQIRTSNTYGTPFVDPRYARDFADALHRSHPEKYPNPESVKPQFRLVYFPILDRIIPILRTSKESVMIAEDSTMIFLKLIDSIKGSLREKSIINMGSYHGAIAAMLAKNLGEQGNLHLTDIREEAKLNTFLTLINEIKQRENLRKQIQFTSSDLHEEFLYARDMKPKFDYFFFNNPIFKIGLSDLNSSNTKLDHFIEMILLSIKALLKDTGEAYLLTAKPDDERLQISPEFRAKYHRKYFSPEDLQKLVQKFNNSHTSKKLKVEFPPEFTREGHKERAIYQIAKLTIIKDE